MSGADFKNVARWCGLLLFAAALGFPAPAGAQSPLKLDSGPRRGTPIRDRTPTFRFSAAVQPDGFECRIDWGEPFACQSPITLPRMKHGRHVLEVAIPAVGDGERVAIRRAFRVDMRAPGTRIRRGPSGRVETIQRRSGVTVRFRGVRGARRFQCRLDGRRWRRCSSPVRRRVGPGQHRFAVRSIDRAGNVDRSPAVRSWVVKRWEPDIRRARRYAARRGGKVSFAVDVGWRVQGVGRHHRARSASTIKAVLMVSYLRRRGVRHRRLDRGEKSLIKAMIRRSDNGAASTVRNIVGAGAIKRLSRISGMRDFEYSGIWGTCQVSAEDYARFMRRLPYLVPSRHRGFALHELASITGSQRWGIGRLRPRGWKLHFKGGWGISDGRYGGLVNHQMALLRRGRWRIGVAILTQGNPSVDYGSETLRGVAARLLRGLPR